MNQRSNWKREKNAEGVKLCLVCHAPLSGRRTSYCSDECAVRNNPGWMRRLVEKRDKGVCAICRFDTKTLLIPTNKWRGASVHFWEMDHIVPVVEGGGLCGLDGMRTLCNGYGNGCHGKESGKLRARLNAAKKQRKTGKLF